MNTLLPANKMQGSSSTSTSTLNEVLAVVVSHSATVAMDSNEELDEGPPGTRAFVISERGSDRRAARQTTAHARSRISPGPCPVLQTCVFGMWEEAGV